MISILKPSTQLNSIHWSWISLCGKDTKDFLHRLTTVHTKKLQVGEGAPGCFLNAQGKVLSSFHLWNYGPGEYAFELDAGHLDQAKSKLLQVVDQYTFSEQQILTDVTPHLAWAWVFFDHQDTELVYSRLGISPLKPLQTQAIDEEIRVCHRGTLSSGQSWLSVWAKPARLEQWLEHHFTDTALMSKQEFEQLRIQNMIPWIDAELSEEVIPLEVGLRGSIAEAKGCYPGQEVIERIISLGAAPRKLALVSGLGEPPQAQDPIFNQASPPVQIGQITSCTIIPQSHEFLALALIKKIHAKEGLAVQFNSQNTRNGMMIKISSYE